MSADLLVRGRKVVLPDGIAAASIRVRGARIEAIEPYGADPNGAEVLDAGDLVIMPGLVDSHVHLNDPGREHWEGFATGTRAAAAGGVTTVVDMPLNSVPATTSLAGLLAKQAAAQGNCSVDVGFWGGVVPGNAPDIEPLLEAGVLGFKCFLVHSGVDEFPSVDESDLRQALPVLAMHEAVLLAHAEVPGPIEAAKPQGLRNAYSTYLASRPPESELEAIDLLIRLCREYRAPTHVVHLATEQAVPQLLEARAAGLPVTVETCPHYLTFEATQIPDGATEFKCAPPIREGVTRQGLWSALEQGSLDLVATDHSPCPPGMKTGADGDFFAAWGGIASLQLGLAAVWTEAKRRGIGIERVAHWMSAAPAKLAGLAGRKGSITPGADADLIFFNPEKPIDWTRPLEHRHALTPYRNLPLIGVVERTILRGQTVYVEGEFVGRPAGLLLASAIHELNHGDPADAEWSLLKCCGSRFWAHEMTLKRPFRHLNHLLEEAEVVAGCLKTEDWLEAFAAHPRIGDRSGSAWSKQEQSKAANANDESKAELKRLNDIYFDRFGFIFIICAMGKPAAEILSAIGERVSHSQEEEIATAAAEQRKITAIRLRKLLGK
jgi:allantoinase